ncbi:MAG: NUDIX domain-containing protein [Planctomycetota bacterium]
MKIFDYCPSCGSKGVSFDGVKRFYCKDCRFTYYHNVAAAVAVVLEYDGKIVLVRRSKEPRKGKLDLPGGFIDPNESAEDAVKREIKEELDIDVGTIRYLASCPNVYEYKRVPYCTCDLFFYSRLDAPPGSFDKSEIEELVLLKPSDVQRDQIAFESTKACLRLFKSSQAC